jgi:hypothetical protein
MDRKAQGARARRQARVAKVVWGTLFLAMGVLFTLEDMGRVDLGEKPRSELAPANAVDGNEKTRWSSAFRDGQWLTVDLGAVEPIRRLRLHWEDAYAKQYEIQVSDDGAEWKTVRKVTSTGGIEEYEVDATGRFVRLLGTARATPYGISLWELQVFDPDGGLISQGRDSAASSVEERNVLFTRWLRFWPLFFVASGLPLLLVPRDDANQVMGLVLTVLGAVLQLDRLGLLPWSLRETSSGLLIVIGLMILLQSLRRGDVVDEPEPGPTEDAR